ncbi:MAG: hypothetical protein N3H31_06720 [Candidatus Nezhaarchaeota archaeon]|nr:hypothetical protein [Candidatus Nezhaarchaeota archaeon]
MMLSFSIAIPIFLALQTVVFLVLMILPERVRAKSTFEIPPKVSMIIARAICALLMIGSSMTIFTNFKYSILYNFLVTLTPAMLIFLIASGFSSKLMPAIAIMWHYILAAPEIGGDFLSITEGVHMTRTMILHGRWLPELAHNPSYNPFPTVAFIRAALSLLTGIPWYNQFIALVILVAVLISFDLAIFVLSSKIASDRNAGILAVMIFALTPYLFVFSHAYQVPANLMWLLSVYMFIRSLSTAKRRYPFLVTLLFFSAILTHATAYIEMILPAVFLLVKYLGSAVNRAFPKTYYSHVVTMALLLIVIGLTRFIFESLYAYYLGKMFFGAVGDLVTKIFLGEELEARLTIYEYGGTPFYQAFLWSLTPSLACALIIQSFSKKSVNSILLSLFLTAFTFIGFGYVTAIAIRVSTQLYRGSYVAFSLLVPLAALAVKKIIDSRFKHLIIILSLVFLLASVFALNDPELSTDVAMKVRGIPEEVKDMRPSVADLIKVNYVMNFAEDIKVVSNIAFYSESTLVYERRTVYGEQIKTVFSKVGDALYKVLYINGYTVGDAPVFSISHVLPEELSDNASRFDIIYCSGKEVFFLTP